MSMLSVSCYLVQGSREAASQKGSRKHSSRAFMKAILYKVISKKIMRNELLCN